MRVFRSGLIQGLNFGFMAALALGLSEGLNWGLTEAFCLALPGPLGMGFFPLLLRIFEIHTLVF